MIYIQEVMKKGIKITLITIIVLFSLYAITNVTGVLIIYKNATIANEPNLKLNAKVFISNLITPQVGDFVSFKFEDPIFGEGVRIFRLCGKENDIFEIKNGEVFLNKINIDENINFTHRYSLTFNDYQNLGLNESQLDKVMPLKISSDSILVLLEDSFAKQKGIKEKRLIEKGSDSNLMKIFGQNWNKDNFGPIRIPKGKVFVLGDNRDNSEDSRYLGFINSSDIAGTVIN